MIFIVIEKIIKLHIFLFILYKCYIFNYEESKLSLIKFILGTTRHCRAYPSCGEFLDSAYPFLHFILCNFHPTSLHLSILGLIKTLFQGYSFIYCDISVNNKWSKKLFNCDHHWSINWVTILKLPHQFYNNRDISFSALVWKKWYIK